MLVSLPHKCLTFTELVKRTHPTPVSNYFQHPCRCVAQGTHSREAESEVTQTCSISHLCTVVKHA